MGAVIAGTVGLQVQRQTLALMAYGARYFYRSLWRPAILLAGGLRIGFPVIPGHSLAPIGYAWRKFSFHFLLAPLWVIGFSGLAWLWLSYARFFAKRVLGIFSTTKAPDWPRRWLTLALGVLLWILLIPGVLGQYIVADYANDPAALTDPAVRAISSSPFYYALPTSLVLFGLIFSLSFICTWLWRIVRRNTCAACGKVAEQRYAVGQDCKHCQAPLALWLFVNPITTTGGSASSQKVHQADRD